MMAPLFRSHHLGVLLFAFSLVSSRDIYIDVSNPGIPDGTFRSPYPNFLEALNVAGNGDRLLVNQGTYKGENNTNLAVFYGLEIRARDFQNRPVIDMENKSRFLDWDPEFYTNGTVNTISGFVFQNGAGASAAASVLQIKSGSVTISKCDFLHNKGGVPGSIMVEEDAQSTPDSPPAIVNIDSCLFQENTAGSGAAVYVKHRFNRLVSIGNSNFFSNAANAGPGGAVYCESSRLLVTGSVFSSNSAPIGYGGAIFAESVKDDVSMTLLTSSFSDNVAQSHGGAIAFFNGGTLTMSRCNFARNSVTLDAERNTQFGGAVHMVGSLYADTCTFESNMCSALGNGKGGGLALDGEGSSFIRDCIFTSNGCRMGSDIAVTSGTAFIYNALVQASDDPFQILVSGKAKFENSRFQDGGDARLRSLIVQGDGVASFEWTNNPKDFEIFIATVEDNGKLQTSSNLVIDTLFFHGGSIEATTTAQSLALTILSNALVDKGSPVIAGFEVINNGTMTIDTSIILAVTNVFVNKKQVFLHPGAVITGRDGFGSVDCMNLGQIYLNVSAQFHCTFQNEPNSLLQLNNAGYSTAPVTILGTASFFGTLSVHLSAEGANYFESGKELRLFRFYQLGADPSMTVVTSPEEKHIGLRFTSTDGYLTHTPPHSTSGAVIALTVLGAIAAACVFGAAVWYFMFRSTPPESYADLSRPTSNYGSA